MWLCLRGYDYPALKTQGLFRVPGTKEKMSLLKDLFENGAGLSAVALSPCYAQRVTAYCMFWFVIMQMMMSACGRIEGSMFTITQQVCSSSTCES